MTAAAGRGGAGALRPAESPIPHARPFLGPDEEAAALRVLRSARLAPGPEAARLETLVARLSDAADAVALASGTLALTLALRALKVGRRDRIALPAYGCAALLHAVRAAGAVPMLCDVDPRTLVLDAGDVVRRGRTMGAPRAVVLVHPFGQAAAFEPFRTGGWLLVEDCAQAPGASERGRPVGSRGDAAVFSFGPTKLVTCGGPGGALASPRAGLVAAARDLAGHDEKERDAARCNGLMGDLHAAVAVAQIERLREIVARRGEVARRYDAAFGPLGVRRPEAAPETRPVFWRYLVGAADAEGCVRRLNAAGIQARHPVHRPLHVLTGGGGTFAGADEAHATWVSLPIRPDMTEPEIARVVAAVPPCLS